MKFSNNILLSVLQKVVKKPEQVFVYETLMRNKLRKKLFKHDTSTHVDRLIGWREINVESTEGKNFHTLIQDETESVIGKRFSVTQDELFKLDSWEEGYLRKKMQLASGNLAWVYFLTKQHMADKGHNIIN